MGEDAAISLECLTCTVCPQTGVSVFSVHKFSVMVWSYVRVCVCVCVSPTQRERGGVSLIWTGLHSNSLFFLQGQDYSCQTGSHHSCLSASERVSVCVCVLISVSTHFLICWDCMCVCVCVYLGGLAGDSDERNCNRRPPAGVEP